MVFRPAIAWVLAASGVIGVVPAAAQSTDAVPPVLQQEVDPALPDSGPVSGLPQAEPEPPPPPLRRSSDVDPFAPTGIEAGGLTLYPSITIGPVFTSNASASPDGSADAGISIGPALRIESDWIRHSYTADFEGDFDFYARNSDLKSRDVDATNTLTLDVRRDTSLALTASYVVTQSGLEDNDVPSDAVGYQTEHIVTGSAALTHGYGPLEFELAAATSYNKYGDVKLEGGGTQDNSDRDYYEPSAGLRVTYVDPPVLKPFAEVAYAPRRHLDLTIAGDPIWQGDLALTYLWRNYADPSLESQSILGLNGSLTWSPTELTSIVFSFETNLDETTNPDASAARSWEIDVEATRAVQDNVDLIASGSVQISDEDGPTDVTYDAGLGIEWRMSPVLAWSAAYDFTWLDAADGERNYTEHLVTAGITLSR
jgi:hypothetical protein